MRSNQIIASIIVLGFILFTMVFKPVIVPNDVNDCLTAEGKVIGIYEAGVRDVAFKLDGNNTIYYINRGLERGLTLEDLEQKVLNNHVVIKYPKHWTPLDPNGTTKHLSVLLYGGETIFSEIRES